MYKVFQKTIFSLLEIPEEETCTAFQFSLESILYYYLSFITNLLYNLIILKNFLLFFPLNNGSERIVFQYNLINTV